MKLAALLLVGCAGMPGTLHAPTESEERAIGSARQAWDAADRPRVECDDLSLARVAVLPHDELQERCSAIVELRGCLVESPALSGAPRFMILVDENLDDMERGSTAIHEALHALRLCAVEEGRVLSSRSQTCTIAFPADHDHCDRELWGQIHADALSRWSRP